MQQTISVKELRKYFPDVRREMKKGRNFIIIYRSKPIAELRPLRTTRGKLQQKSLEAFVNPPKDVSFASRKSAVDLVRAERK